MFLSYASGDRPIAERLARAIEQAGLSVWWDRHIKGGSEFSRDIERQLDDAAHVLVLWSKEAVNSRWVRDEASVAVDTGRLVAATIDGTPAPLGFRQFQTIDLRKWTARTPDLPAELLEALDVEPRDAVPAASPKRARVPTAAIVGALLVTVAGGVAIVRPPPFDRWLPGEQQANEVALAIMPFVTQGGEDIAFLGAGLSSALADSLAPLSGLRITASTSTSALAGRGLTAPEIGDRLKVTHLVEGDVQQSADRLLMSVRLVDSKTSEQIWTRTFEGAANQLQQLKSQMSRELAGALRARLRAGEGDVADRGRVDPKAYEAYLRALERVSVRDVRNSRAEAIRQFRLAATIQPDFADAHAGYAYLLALSVPDQVNMEWPVLVREQNRATARALELDPDNELALTAKATALQNYEGKVDESLAIVRSVLERSPNLVPALYSMGAGLWMRGRSREAVDYLDHAIELDPFDNLLRFYRGKVLYSLGDYQAVRTAAQQCFQNCAGMGWYWILALSGFGNADDYRADFPTIARQGREAGYEEEDIDEGRRIVEAFVLDRPYVPKPLDEGDAFSLSDAALESRLVGFEAGMRMAERELGDIQADAVLDILNEGRVTFTPQQRADPRYHALFRHPKLARIAAARRQEGVTAGLPVFPVKPYTGR